VILLKNILKFTLEFPLKQLRNISVQIHYHQLVHYFILTNAPYEDGVTVTSKHSGAVLMHTLFKFQYCLLRQLTGALFGE